MDRRRDFMISSALAAILILIGFALMVANRG
jgi:hypothetical protein